MGFLRSCALQLFITFQTIWSHVDATTYRLPPFPESEKTTTTTSQQSAMPNAAFSSNGDDLDPWVSRGRCFFDNSGDEAPSRYIPCGNSNFGHLPCCESGDMCLSSGACYNGQYGVTYLSGCTDQSYEDKNCPGKGSYSDDAWVGLAYCNGTSNEWVGCEVNRGSNTVTKAKSCWCPQTSRTVAIHDASVLANVVSLGTAEGLSVQWQGGFVPDTATMTPTALQTSILTGAGPSDPDPDTSDWPEATATVGTISITTSGSVPSMISENPSADTESDTSSLGPGAKAGIGVGVGAGSIALAGFIFALLRRHKRKKSLETYDDTHPSSARPVTLYTNSDFPDDDLRSPAWSGHKSELDAVATASPSLRYPDFVSTKSEAEGSPAVGSAGRPLTNGGYEMHGKQGPVFEMPA